MCYASHFIKNTGTVYSPVHSLFLPSQHQPMTCESSHPTGMISKIKISLLIVTAFRLKLLNHSHYSCCWFHYFHEYNVAVWPPSVKFHTVLMDDSSMSL